QGRQGRGTDASVARRQDRAAHAVEARRVQLPATDLPRFKVGGVWLDANGGPPTVCCPRRWFRRLSDHEGGRRLGSVPPALAAQAHSPLNRPPIPCVSPRAYQDRRPMQGTALATGQPPSLPACQLPEVVGTLPLSTQVIELQ